MKLLDLTLVLAVLGHGAWGLWSIAGDYLARGPLRAASVIVATGGKSIPKMGATGLGYQIAESFGLPGIL